jgi:hypothetical protein
VTIQDPTVWSRPWTVRQEFGKQSEQQNKISALKKRELFVGAVTTLGPALLAKGG